MLGALNLDDLVRHRRSLMETSYSDRIDFPVGCYGGAKWEGTMKRRKFKKNLLVWIVAVLFFFPMVVATGQDTDTVSPKSKDAVSKKSEEPAPKSELDNLKAEWEAVREQQIQMIREKEDQLEKLKEEIFSKMKAPAGSVVTTDSAELEAQKAAFQVERQKFFSEMSRQKENLRQLQSALDEKTKQLEAERDRFEQEKKTATH